MSLYLRSLFLISTFLFSTSSFAARPVRGFYEVPVNEELKPFSRYPVKFKADNYQQDPNTISFPMPSALLGEETIVTMSRLSDQDNIWSGPNVTGHCQTIDRIFRCTVQFDPINVDPIKLESVIKQQYPLPSEADGRLQVALHFSGEPIGIISYKLRGKDK